MCSGTILVPTWTRLEKHLLYERYSLISSCFLILYAITAWATDVFPQGIRWKMKLRQTSLKSFKCTQHLGIALQSPSRLNVNKLRVNIVCILLDVHFCRLCNTKAGAKYCSRNQITISHYCIKCCDHCTGLILRVTSKFLVKLLDAGMR